MNDRPEWFAPKRYGYGAGLPVAWQGWAVFVGFLAVMMASAVFLAPRNLLAWLALVISLTIAFVLIARMTTRGGWRWRWGDDQ